MSPLLRPGRVRPIFRALGWVLGTAFLMAGLFELFVAVRESREQLTRLWVHHDLWLGFTSLSLSWMLLYAARTGRDPYVLQGGDDSAGASRPH